MKKIRLILLAMIILAFGIGLTADTTQSFSPGVQAEDFSYQDSAETIEIGGAYTAETGGAETLPELLKKALGNVISIVLIAIISALGIWLKEKFDIIIEMPKINKEIRKTALNVDKYNISSKEKVNQIKAELNSKLTVKQKSIVTKVWDTVEDAIEDVFYNSVKPERIYKFLKGIVK